MRALKTAGELSGVRIADKYELIRLIGRGGMGSVYEARNISTLKRCAVKVLLTPELAGDAEVVKRFFREARASGVIESEHVVAAFDSGIDAANHVYYVMECLQGEDLEQALDRIGPLDPTAATKIALQAAAGLASAHALGIVHRDVKPANLFLAKTPHGGLKVKILDFGVAKVKMEVFNESAHSLTHSGTLLGTPLYMSPEQLRRASAIDESADVWSLGVVLFECLTGQLPWGSFDGIGELVTAILTSPLPHVQDLAPWVEPRLADVVHRALSRDASQRLKNATELGDCLRRITPSAELQPDDIAPPLESMRSSRAPRLSVADTVMIGPPLSGLPIQTSVAHRASRRAHPLVLGLGIALGSGAGVGAWMMARPTQPLEHTRSNEGLADQRAPAAGAGTSSASQPPAPSARHYSLQVGPSGAEVTVDGERVKVTDNRVPVEGIVGTVRNVRIAHSGHVLEQRVAITGEGLVPPKVQLLPAPQKARAHKGSTNPDNTVPRPSLAQPSGATESVPAVGLSETFE